MTTEPQREGDQLTLEAAAPRRSTEHGFKDYSDAEVVKAELEVLGVDATRHIVTFFEPLLRDLDVTRAKDLRRVRGGRHVMVAGVKVASQTPAIRSGQRIIFLTLDDATGPVDVTVFEALAMGKPIVATDADGLLDILTDTQDAVIVPRRDAEALIEPARRVPVEHMTRD
jgi:DNA polymerase III alpha subunit